MGHTSSHMTCSPTLGTFYNKLLERDPAGAAAEIAEARRVAAQSMQEVRNAVAAPNMGSQTRSNTCRIII